MSGRDSQPTVPASKTVPLWDWLFEFAKGIHDTHDAMLLREIANNYRACASQLNEIERRSQSETPAPLNAECSGCGQRYEAIKGHLCPAVKTTCVDPEGT